MSDLRIKEYLAQVGIRRVHELDTALREAFGQEEGEKHIKKLTELYDRSEERLVYGSKDTAYLRRQEELVDYLNQSLQMSLLAASFYDRVFFRRAMEALLRYEQFFAGDILDIGCGNGILTCFLARVHPDASVTGLDLSQMAVSAAEELAGRLRTDNVRFASPQTLNQKNYAIMKLLSIGLKTYIDSEQRAPVRNCAKSEMLPEGVAYGRAAGGRTRPQSTTGCSVFSA